MEKIAMQRLIIANDTNKIEIITCGVGGTIGWDGGKGKGKFNG